MIEELPDDIEQDELDDIEPVGDENQLYEHFRGGALQSSYFLAHHSGVNTSSGPPSNCTACL